MPSNYTELFQKADEIKQKLIKCAKTLDEIKYEDKRKYENPQYRMWSGDIKDLEGFTLKLEEWLNQPSVAEAKRYLLDLKKWSESPEKIFLEELQKDWRFLSDNLEEIKDIHKQIGDIGYEGIMKKTTTWVLNRILEKDIERAKNWAINSNKFADSLKQLENKKSESKLAEGVKGEAVAELLKTTSFEKDNKETVVRYQELVDRAENIVKNKPAEIEERAILNTNMKLKDKKIEERLPLISTELERIRTFLIDLEWIKKSHNFKDYNGLWTGKQSAIKENDLESIKKALEGLQQQAERWKDTRKRELESIHTRIVRMSRNIEEENLRKEVASLEGKIQEVDWSKPDVQILYAVLSQTDKVRKQLHEKLIKKLENEDAISLIEEPKLIEDFGKSRGWDFERFIKALRIVLENGLIEIRAVEEK